MATAGCCSTPTCPCWGRTKGNTTVTPRPSAGSMRGWRKTPTARDGGAVLEGFLRRPRIYHTDALYARLEERAHRNLRREIAALGGNGE